MIKKFNKVIILILLFIMLFVMLLSKGINATDTSNPKYKKSDYKTRAALIAAGEKAVGKRVWIHNGGNDGVINQLRESDHVYCIHHHANTDSVSALYNIVGYARIEGDRAYRTKSKGTPVENKKNVALAYLLSQEGYRLGYSGSGTDKIRTRAVHGYLDNNGSWFSSVGTKLGISRAVMHSAYFSDSSIINFINRANAYSNKADNKYPTISSNKKKLQVEFREYW